tara:strand:- start:507 stop:938 length:432 start_codon:yes stop_codon:yes gene_type:complete
MKHAKSIVNRFNRAVEVAKALKPSKGTGRAFHVTFIFDKNKLISIASNNYNKTHPKIPTLNYRDGDEKDNEYNPCIHSELAAWLKIGEENCSRYTFFNVRIDKNNKVGMSKPCSGCSHLLSQVGFKRFYYTDDKGKLKEFIQS